MEEHIKRLEAQGFIELLHRFDKRGRQRSNLYQMYTLVHLHVELEENSALLEVGAASTTSASPAPIIS